MYTFLMQDKSRHCLPFSIPQYQYPKQGLQIVIIILFYIVGLYFSSSRVANGYHVIQSYAMSTVQMILSTHCTVV